MKNTAKEQTGTLSELLATGGTAEALAYLEHVISERKASLERFCTDPYIDAVFYHYHQRFQELGAPCRMNVQVGEDELPYPELCQILASGLENAYEAMGALDEKDREVSIQVKYNRGYLMIRIKNRCRQDLNVKRGTIPETDKKDGPGMGLQTIQETARQLGGGIQCYTEMGYFILDVMVRVKAKSRAAE